MLPMIHVVPMVNVKIPTVLMSVNARMASQEMALLAGVYASHRHTHTHTL